MQIGFFPFTYINRQTAEVCHSLFGAVTIYQPVSKTSPDLLQEMAEAGMLRLQAPVSGNDAHLVSLCRDFHQWGQLHQGDAAVLKKIAEGGFYNEEFIPEIRSEILKGGAETPEKPDPVFNARLFLLLAQEFDAKNAELEADLRETDKAAQDLFAQIKGEQALDEGPPPNVTPHPPQPDPGVHMTESRLGSWFCLMTKDERPPDLLLTSSPAVVSSMGERFETMTFAGALSAADSGKNTIPVLQMLSRLATGEISPAESRKDLNCENPILQETTDGLVLDVYVIPERSPREIAAAFMGEGNNGSAQVSEAKNCVVACLRDSRQA